MAKSLILQSTPLAQWHALVTEARQSSSIKLSEDLESYLVFLLMRFTKDSHLSNSILAMEFLENIHKSGHENLQRLREVGDKCLLFSGFFAGLAKHRRVQISYYVSLGQSAYSSLSEFYQNQLSSLFGELSQHFVSLMDILHYLRELAPNTFKIDLLEATELWQQARSKHALRRLQTNTNGFILPSSFLAHSKKH